METRLKDNIDWVGYLDWTVRDFHSYNTVRGATYNAYLIRDEKTVLIDTVKKPYSNVLLKNIGNLIDPAKIDLVVCNHAEPDHAGELAAVLAVCPKAKVVCNKKCRAALALQFDISNWDFEIVKTGDSISIGKNTLQFIDTPMVHWPESMFTYIPEQELLFSMDAFGQHFASSHRFDDETPIDQVKHEAKKYYANIVMPYGRQVAKTLQACSDLKISMIAPSHGVIWRENVSGIINAYADWCVFKPRAKVLVIYDTMWDSTAKMARAILDGAAVPGVNAKLIHVRSSSLTDIVTDVLDASCIAFGSSTLNMDMMPMAAAALTYLRGLRPANKTGFAFGSYGWGRGGAEAILEYMKAMKWELPHDIVRAKYLPDEETLDKCRDIGRLLADKAKSMTKDSSAVDVP
jgi:flavorubredoxin